MDLKKLGLGLGAFAAGAAAWTFGSGRYGDKLARLLPRPSDKPRAPVAPRRDVAPAPVGMAETDKHFAERAGSPAAEHVPTDLLSAQPVTTATRAPDAFRPDPTAVPTAEEREALRPATGPSPTLVSDRGSGFSDAAGAA